MKPAFIPLAIGLTALTHAEAVTPIMQEQNPAMVAETEKAWNGVSTTLRAITAPALFELTADTGISLSTTDVLKEITPAQVLNFPVTLPFDSHNALTLLSARERALNTASHTVADRAPKLNIPEPAAASLCMTAFVGLIGRRRRK